MTLGKGFSEAIKKAARIFLSPTVTLIILLLVSVIVTTVTERSITASEEKLVPIYSVARNDKKIALTIDAAWGNEYTEKIIEILDGYGVKITFFTTDFWANEYPEDVKKLVLAGHEIGNHSLTHPDMTKLSEEEIRNELLTTWKTQKKLAGSSAVRLFRAPYGSYNNSLIKIANENGFECIQWSVDSIDWKEGVTADEVKKRVRNGVQSGSIILMHNNSRVITDVLPAVIEELLNEGYTFVPVSQLIYKTNYTVDKSGVQHGTN